MTTDFSDGLNTVFSHHLDSSNSEKLDITTWIELELENSDNSILSDFEFTHAFNLGRHLAHLQERLSMASSLPRGDNETISVFMEFIKIGHIFSDMYIIEHILFTTQFCPTILTQIKQQRQSIARKYLKDYLDSENIDIEKFKSLEDPPELLENLFLAKMHIIYMIT